MTTDLPNPREPDTPDTAEPLDGAEDDSQLKAAGAGTDTADVAAPVKHMSFVGVAVVLVVVLAVAAGATLVGVNISDPLAFERSDGQVVQVLPTPPTPVTTAPPAPPAPGTFDVRTFLGRFSPGVAHDAFPHGVPRDYDWASRATFGGLEPPTASSRFMNAWGIVYADETDVRPPNTRVNITGCELWSLGPTGTTWQRLIQNVPTDLGGGAWNENIRGDVAPFDLRTEPDGTQSTAALLPGRNSHFWPEEPLVDVGSGHRAFVVACSTRLIVADPRLVDDRARSTYLLALGADWRERDHRCPVIEGITICDGLGTGRFVRVTNQWQRVVYSTMSSTQLGQLPLPPAEAFRNPDGTFGAG